MMRRLTSGQNSWKALLPIRPANPSRVRTAACCASASLATRHEGHFYDVLDSPAKRSSWRTEIARVLSPQSTDSCFHRIPCRHSGEAHPIPLSEALPSSTVFLWAVASRAESCAENAASETLGSDRAL